MKKIGLFLFAAVMSLLAVSCRDVLLEKNIGGFSVSFQTPGSSSRAGTTATWELEAWLELEGGAQLQKKNETVPANAPITISFDAVPIGTKLKVQVRLEDSENQYEGSSDWITVDAESKTVVVQVQRMIINAAAPTITTQPESQNNRSEAGSDAPWTVTLTVAATSPDSGNLSYQWYENTANSNSGGTLIAEATKENYHVPLNPGETKYFYCKVTNTNNTVNGDKDATTTSDVAAIVYVKTTNAVAPTIDTQPESQDNRSEAGSDAPWTVTLRVAATSPDGGNLSYEWYENTAHSNSGGTPIPGATKEYYQVPLNPGETKYFYCVVTNTNDGVNGDQIATTTSNVAAIVYVKTINAAAPTIDAQPQSLTKEYQAGGEVSWAVTLTVAATSPDGGNLSYQWYKNTANSNSGGKLIPEATKEYYQVGLIPGETKYFYCVVTNTNDGVNGTKDATTTSNVAKLVYDIAQSGVLLWKRTDSGSPFGRLIVPYGDYDAPGTELPGDLYRTVSWCFDNAGNLYWYAEGENGAQCYNLQSDGSYTRGDYYYPPVSALSYDNVESILYGISDTQILKLETSGSNQIIDFSNNVITPVGFAVHDNIAYIVDVVGENNDGIPQIIIRNYNLRTSSLLKESSMYQLPTSFGTNPSYQMIYQDGALYLLLGCVEDSTPNISSVGAVVKIDPTTLRLDASFGTDGYLGLSTERKVPYQDWSGENQLCSVYAASSPTEKVFSNPLGFVAIMPKKLVIADAGCIVYDEIVNQGGVPKLKGKAVSRIVTVDLETQSLGFEDLEPNQYYWTSNPLGSSVDIPSDTSSSYF